ncbi:PREDICTED: keratin-associated protein 12-2-like, partial [Apaloderma vittatum]|uniref:keratin-associated protein 12-2-like n=1 Tax=Apaloderma vittatum TaxID=57397 RepID=UPI00052121FE
YLNTVIPYEKKGSPPSVEDLQMLTNILFAMKEGNEKVPTLLTDYILKGIRAPLVLPLCLRASAGEPGCILCKPACYFTPSLIVVHLCLTEWCIPIHACALTCALMYYRTSSYIPAHACASSCIPVHARASLCIPVHTCESLSICMH